MSQELKNEISNRLKQAGAFDVKVADPYAGFENSVKGKHPLDLWKECRSVIVFAVVMSPQTNNFYAGPYAPWVDENRDLGYTPQSVRSSLFALDKMCRLFREAIKYKGMKFLSDRGYDVSFVKAQTKLCAYESGLGVYGRNGLIIHPVLGNRICLEAIFTNAILPPDKKMLDFNPCEKCDERCLKSCPGEAFDLGKKYPDSWNEGKCLEARSKIEEEGKYCHNCFVVCPAGTLEDENLLCLEEIDALKCEKG